MNASTIEMLIRSLKEKQYQVSYFESSADAVQYLCSCNKNKVIGFGDSLTIQEMHLKEALSRENQILDPTAATDNDEFLHVAKECLTSDVFMTSVNAVTKDGILVNMDGTGNRVAGSLFGHKKVYFILGVNKITEDLDKAVFRVRNITAPRNAKRLGYQTPCAKEGKRCYDCKSPARICNILAIHLHKLLDTDESEVVLINEKLGL